MTLVRTGGAPFTYADLQELPDDGRRHELIDGVLIVTPSPRTVHQLCVGGLYRLLYAAAPTELAVMLSPYDWKLSELTVFVPDLLVTRRSDLGELRLEQTPLLVVEVLSPSTRRIDLDLKKGAFEDAGVPAYWVVDPAGPSLTAFGLRDGGRYAEVATVTGDERFDATDPFAVALVPSQLLAG